MKRLMVVLLLLCPARMICAQPTGRLEAQLLAEGVAALTVEARERGDAARGAIVFHQPHMACVKCHALDGREPSLGPDLTKFAEPVSDQQLVEAVLFPSQVIRKGYEPVTLLTTAGDVITGLRVDGTGDEIALREPSTGRILRFKSEEIEQQRPGELSIMPAGQANQLGSRQQFLDLVRYLMELRDGGPARAKELQPPAALYALQLPDYETHVDHAGLIRALDDKSFERGREIYERLCINCHGTLEQPGSLPTALRFGEGKFKSGSDPFTMYRTLTYGFGFMVPQMWMVPRQKYDVIHYIRQAYLAPHNPSQYHPADDVYLAGLPAGDTFGPKPVKYEPWSTMDYGSHLAGTYEVPAGAIGGLTDATHPGATAGSSSSAPHPIGGLTSPARQRVENFAYKGIAVRLDPGAGGVAQGRAWMIFDHDTMRMAAAWTTDEAQRGQRFIDWQGIHFDGRHNAHPRVVGDVVLQNPTGPGWAHPATRSFDDDARVVGRDGKRYGPLPHDWARYDGFYVHNDQTILKYAVDDAEILERPGLLSVARAATPPGEATTDLPIFTRTFHIGPHRRPLTLLVTTATGHDPQLTVTADGLARLRPSERPERDESDRPTFDGSTWLQLDQADDFEMAEASFTLTARLRTRLGGVLFAKTSPGEEWVPGGKAFFVRAGKLCYDVGWEGVAQSDRRVDDGEWHHVAMTWDRKQGLTRLFVDGKPAGKKRVDFGAAVDDAVIRLGYGAPDFPDPSFFVGDLRDVCFYQELLTEDDLRLLVDAAGAATAKASLRAHWSLTRAPAEGEVRDETGRHAARVHRQEPARATDGPLLAGVRGLADPHWQLEGSRLTLTIPAREEPLSFTLGMARDAQPADITAALAQPAAPIDLADLQAGGTPRWPERLTTQPVLGDEAGPFAVDVLTAPTANPWRARTRLSGLDFFPDGDRLAVCAWDGDVWLVEGLRSLQTPEPKLVWQRIAAGLFQPLGLKIVDGQIYVTCRDQIVILRDLNGDGETDFYECFNDDQQVTEHFHEFAMGLQVDTAGNFYYAKSARHALPAIVPQHGTLLRVSPDGAYTEILANGFRAANGVCLNDDGTFIVTDQEGHWNPKNRINWVTPATGSQVRFYGNMFGYHDVTDEADSAMEQPLCWITNAFDRSPAELLWVESDRWGPLDGSLLNLSYGYGKVYVVPFEDIGGQKQGGMCALPIEQFPTGTMRGRFAPGDGQLYLCGLYAWASSQQAAEGGLYRIRATGKAMHLPVGLRATSQGMSITFTDPLDPQTAGDPANYTVQVWSLRRTAKYGSDHYDERPLEVTAATLSPDGRTVQLTIPGIAPTWCMEIRCELRGASGEPVDRVIHNTVHALGL